MTCSDRPGRLVIHAGRTPFAGVEVSAQFLTRPDGIEESSREKACR